MRAVKPKSPDIILQQGERDCGVACLLSVIKYYGGDNNLETLRALSGTSISGTTLLGLYQAAKQTGFDAQGCEADISSLVEYGAPCILHANQNHYVVCFGTTTKKGELQFIIGDPAKGILYLNEEETDKLWASRKCLELTPNNDFKRSETIKQEKRKWIIGLIKEDASILYIAALLGIAIAVLGLIMAIFSQRLIDEILPKKEYVKLNMGIVLVFLLLVIKEGLSILRQYFLLRQSKDFNNRITDFFYTHLLQLPKLFFDTRKIGELTARLNDTTRIQRVISQLAGNTVIDTLVVIVSISFIFNYSWQVGVICTVIIPLFYLLILLQNKKIISGQRMIMSNYAVAEANYISTLQGIETVKNQNKQNIFSANNKHIYLNYQDSIFSLGKVQIKLAFLVNMVSVVFLISMLGFTSYQVIQGHLKAGQLIAVLSLCGILLPSVVNLALLAIPIQEAKIAFDRMFEFTSTKAEDESGRHEDLIFESLDVQSLRFRFAGRSPIIRNISFKVNKGRIIALMGDNGCGKSTLTQILQKHYDFESGDILINNDIPLTDIHTQSWRKLTGVVPQNTHVFNCSILENIAFNDAYDKPQEVLTFLQQYGFDGFVDSFPQSYMTLIGEEGINLSGGQKQMIALMRALYHKPQLLILDEATAAMDRQSEEFVLQLLLQLKQHMGIIFITHKIHTLRRFCDDIYILENGEVTNFGTHAQLLASNNPYSLYWADLVAEA